MLRPQLLHGSADIPITLSTDDQGLLNDLKIDQEHPGTILKDFQTCLNFIEEMEELSIQ